MPLRFDNPHVVKVRRGGVVFAHYLTAHGIFENAAPHVRMALYFRVNATTQSARLEAKTGDQYAALKDPWMDWNVGK